mgnify:FL=1
MFRDIIFLLPFVLLISLAIRGIFMPFSDFTKMLNVGFIQWLWLCFVIVLESIFFVIKRKKPPLLHIYGFSTIVPQFRLHTHGKNVSAWKLFSSPLPLSQSVAQLMREEWKRKGRSEKLLQIKWGLLHIPFFLSKELSPCKVEN